MPSETKTPVIVFLVLLMGGIATMDALFTRIILPEEELVADADTEDVSTQETQTGTKVEEVPASGVSVASGPNVMEILKKQGFSISEEKEPSLIAKILPREAKVQSHILIHENDRAGTLSWVDSTRVKVYYLALKEALHVSFSPKITDLIDETKQEKGRPVQNILTFLDPGLSEERLVFIRVRQRLYELHIAEGKEDLIFTLIDDLTK